MREGSRPSEESPAGEGWHQTPAGVPERRRAPAGSAEAEAQTPLTARTIERQMNSTPCRGNVEQRRCQVDNKRKEARQRAKGRRAGVFSEISALTPRHTENNGASFG
jgi:hypothetical protein